MTQQNEFKVFGLTMTKMTIGYGLMLILWGAGFSIGSKSFTSWIPSILGAPILISGLLAYKVPAKRKVWMHVAVLFGLLGFVGGFRFFKGLGSDAGLFGKPKAAASQLMLLITGAVYTVSCIRSFIWARKNRAEAQD
ncbi:MAG TPA: hypothetical protein DCQ06_05955 [Myxococcales bacterium]|nr:hypothetical protein [Myxococcales bacterium]HAN31125.1 hypothetical protein [Myxococcales bacterium]